jgi:integrase
MSIFKNGTFYHYEFLLDGRRRRGSTGTTNKQQAINEERRQRERFEKSYNQVIEDEARDQQRKTIRQAAEEFLVDYKLKHRSPTFAVYALGHVTNLIGSKLVVEITPTVVKRYQRDRLAEKAGPKTINDEVQLLIRLCGEQGILVRAALRRDKALKLPLPASPGRPYSAEEKTRMLEEAQKLRTPQMWAALALDLNTGLRDKELREITWEQIDLIHKKALTVGQSKTEAGTGRVIPLNETAIGAMEVHAEWYTRRFGECRPEWFVFAFGTPLPKDPTRPITSFKTAWIKVRLKAGVKGRWHDNRHTLITELAESGAGDEVIMSIAGHVSRAMLSRYSHVRMEAKRIALDGIAARQRAADQKRQKEPKRKKAATLSPSRVASGSVGEANRPNDVPATLNIPTALPMPLHGALGE